MRKTLLFFVLLVLGTSACDNRLDIDIPANGDGYVETPGRHIWLSAYTETDSEATKTSLEGNRIVWSTGDQFSLLTAEGEEDLEVLDVLVAKITAASTGLGIPVSTSSNQYIRYSGIKVSSTTTTTTGNRWNQVTTTKVNDITSSIVSSDASTSNSYKFGIYNSNSKYQYAPASTSVYAQSNTNKDYHLPVVQASSSLNTGSTPYYVQLKGVEYSSDQKNWTSVDSRTVLDNGSKWGKYDLNYTWNSMIVDDPSGLTFSTSYTPSSSSSTASNNRFTLASGASFEGTLAHESLDHYAVYPYSSSNSYDGQYLNFSLPATQTYAENSFGNGANPMVGKLVAAGNDDYVINFKNACGVLRLNLTGSITVTSIEVADNDSAFNLWGDAKVDVANLTAGAEVSGGSNTITLNCPGGVALNNSTPTQFNIVVPAGAFASGLTIVVRNSEGSVTLGNNASNTIQRNDIKSFPTIPMDAFPIITDFNVENESAKAYMAESNAKYDGSTSNWISSGTFKTANSITTYASDRPRMKTISFTGSASTANVIMATNSSYTDPVLNVTTTLSNGKGEYVLKNMVPGKTYYYKVVAGDEVLTSGAFHAVGQLRMIAIDKGFNIRDIGGWRGYNGKTVKYEQIYRGGGLGGVDYSGNSCDISDADRAELYRIGIRAQLDLRAVQNSGKWTGGVSYQAYTTGHTHLSSGADFINIMTDYGYENEDAALVSDIAWIIYELKKGCPVYFNCRQGADRTGAVAFMIEGLLGCYDQKCSENGVANQMAMDYELTSFSHAERADNDAKVNSAIRGAQEAYGNDKKIFARIVLNDIGIPSPASATVQDRCYYYLNQYWKNNTASKGNTAYSQYHIGIDSADLNWFIEYMLDLPSGSFTTPSYAVSGDDLLTVAKANANL